MNFSNLRQSALEILIHALAAVDPYRLMRSQIRRQNDLLILPDKMILDLKSFKHVYITGAGKSCAPMACALEEILGDYLTGGQIIVKYGHTTGLAKIVQHQAGHPLPDENSLKATRQLLDYMTRFTPDDLVFLLVGGGGSALLEMLPDGISLKDLADLNRLLLECSASIQEMNCVRKHVSRVKGGQLARHIAPARAVALILSDVAGDDLAVIASAPAAPDPSTYIEAKRILQKYNILSEIPDPVRVHLQCGASGEIPETPKPGDEIFKSIHNLVIGNNKLALTAAGQKASELGFNVSIYSDCIQEPVEHLAQTITRIIKDIWKKGERRSKPECILMGGEPVVRVKGKGKGGRNQHLALLVADQLGITDKPYLFMSCGSDGTDGPTEAAGAVVTSETLKLAAEKGLIARDFLNNYDAYNFLEPLDLLIKTGPTLTNVMDVMMVMVP